MEENGFVLQPWVCQTCLPKKIMFSQNSHLYNWLHLFRKSIFSILKNQGTQPRSQVMVQTKDTQQRKTFLSCLWEHKIFPDILFLDCYKHLKTFSIKYFWTSTQEIHNHIFRTSKQEVHTHFEFLNKKFSFWTTFGPDPLW